MGAIAHSTFPNCAVSCASDLAAALAAVAEWQFDLIILDLGLPDSNGIDTLARVRAKVDNVPIVVLSEDSASLVVRAIIAEGAAGFLPKSLPADVIASALKVIAFGGLYVLPHGTSGRESFSKATDRGYSHLTDRQNQILQLIASGYDNRNIAHRLSISEGTVKQHVHALYVALGVSSRTEAVLAAFGKPPRSELARHNH